MTGSPPARVVSTYAAGANPNGLSSVAARATGVVTRHAVTAATAMPRLRRRSVTAHPVEGRRGVDRPHGIDHRLRRGGGPRHGKGSDAVDGAGRGETESRSR